jgi:2,3-diketo-5-methylthio-1-phosphopentane phosphatase
MNTPRAPFPASFYLCDFDGTVAVHDVGNRFFCAFIPEREAHDALLAGWYDESLGGRDILARECDLARVDETAAIAFAVRHAAVDPHFAGFVSAARAAGGDVAIASDGLLDYIRPILAANGLGHVEASANALAFEDAGRVRPRFGSADGEGCGRCGSCKGEVLRRRGQGYARRVFVGDGLSDCCGARAADVVYAKDDLLAWCAREGIAATPYRDFADVAAREGLGAAGASAPAPPPADASRPAAR